MSKRADQVTKRLKRSNRPRNRMIRQLLFQYVIALMVFAVAFVFLIVFAATVRHTISGIFWLTPIYELLNWAAEYFPLTAGMVCLTGWVLLTAYFFSRPMRYMDEVIRASEQLAQSPSEPIVLPGSIKNVQDELNLVREQALRNALLAKEAEQRKNDLIVYLAHDLKTPLTSVIGYLTLLHDEAQISEELRDRYTGIALEKALRLEDLINEFFDITRFNLSTLTLETQRINLSRMLEQITSEFMPILAEKKLGWHTDIEPDAEIICDPDKLERVFDNLIRNAVNYSYEGTDIYLTMGRKENQVEIRIQNHGKTIPAEKLERIFEQFFRLDSSRASATGGAGLGLAIAKEIVELHGGSIRAESAEERIAFTVLLPDNVRKS